MSKLLAVYVGQGSAENLRFGLDNGIWGFNNNGRPDDLNFEVGDFILLASGYSDGSPRTNLEKWLQGHLARVFVGVLTRGFYESTNPVWPDESEMHPEKRYMHRIEFELAGEFQNIELSDGSKISPSLADEIRRSGCAAGKGFASQITEFPIFSIDQGGKRDEPTEMFDPDELFAVLQRYEAENILFQSSSGGAGYSVQADGVKYSVNRLDAFEHESISRQAYLNHRGKLQGKNGRMLFSEFNGTSAIRNCILQAVPLALSPDRKEVVDVSNPKTRTDLFCEILKELKVDRSQGNPKLYKPALLACVIESIETGELSENKITFDWIAPRFISKMKSLGQEANEDQAAQAFCHLKGDMIWLHAVVNPRDPMKDGREGPEAAREKVKYALIKDTFWEALQNSANRKQAMNSLQKHWFDADQSNPPTGSEPAPIPTLDDSFIQRATSAIKDSGLIFEEAFLQRFLFSLLAKPFVILTGTSGTGKTQLALKFAQWLVGEDGYELVPVGADWTDNRQVLGQYNPFDRVFVSTRVLDVLLRADSDPSRPYFLILDEMNLSHVERYFADFLSGLESGDSISLHRHGSDVKTAKGVAVPEQIKIPKNLFIVGTVNIDETTHMFSPKVLDRANVLEFAISKGGFKQFFDSAAKKFEIASGGGSSYAPGFLALSNQIRFDDLGRSELADCQADIEKTLLDLFSLLEETGIEFAFRTATEIERYCRAALTLTPSESWKSALALDAQILQKILPKLHGSRRRIEPLLAGLCEYCKNTDREAAEKLMGNSSEGLLPLPEDANAKFSMSYRKLVRMIHVVRRDQFVSFIQ